jgi:hypothetical protein
VGWCCQGRERLFDFRSLRNQPTGYHGYVFYTRVWRMSRAHLRRRVFSVYFSARVIGWEERGVKTANGKIQKEQEQSEAQPDGA